MHVTDKPLTAPPLTSYRYAGSYGWIMIGAKDNADALKEAARSTNDPISPEHLQIWDGKEYVPLICLNCTHAILARS